MSDECKRSVSYNDKPFPLCKERRMKEVESPTWFHDDDVNEYVWGSTYQCEACGARFIGQMLLLKELTF